MDLYFSPASSPGDSEVERAVADGNVTVTQPGRRATGEHAEYFAAAERMELTGGPPTLYDADKGFTTGQRLTFFLRDDRIFLDGGEKSPAYSRHRIPQ
jgi:lipopolysaccharide export system protein LptA